ncbi:Arc family DNA-binding protein [Clostridiaceae bacterium]|nr:Arc family DNA-binding protein [Clostridiaceae bacterium]
MGGRASAASKNKWISKTYDRINLTVPKGDKEAIRAFAAEKGESVNGFINRIIHEAMNKESAEE